MGSFIYEHTTKVEIEDRALTRLQIVIAEKLRRGEPFTFTWKEDPSIGGGRTTVWLSSRSVITYKFYGSRPPAINPHWVRALEHTADSRSGLYLVHEPAHGSPGTSTGPVQRGFVVPT